MVKLKEVWKIFPDGTKALKGVSLEVAKGEFVGIMGPSGSGKSTLLHIVGGLDRPTSGEVYLMGREISSLSEEDLVRLRKGKVAYIFQFYYLLEDFSVLENLTVIGEILGVEKPEEKALELLEFLRLDHRKNHKPHQLSGGEQQRVAIGRALIGDPELILADEPTGNIDWAEGRKIFDLFKNLNEEKGITFLVATHNPDLKSYFDRIIYLKDGEIVGS